MPSAPRAIATTFASRRLNKLQAKFVPVFFGRFVGTGGELAQIASALFIEFLAYPSHIVNGRLFPLASWRLLHCNTGIIAYLWHGHLGHGLCTGEHRRSRYQQKRIRPEYRPTSRNTGIPLARCQCHNE